MYKKIFNVLMSILLMFGSIISVNADSFDENWSEWSETETGLPGEVSKTQYRYATIEKYSSTEEEISEETSTLANIYYVDTEFVIMNNGKFLSSDDAYTGDNTAKTYTNASNIKYTPSQTVYSNKWGFEYGSASGETSGGRRTTTDLGHSTYSNYSCWAGSCSGRPSGTAKTNTVNVSRSDVTVNPNNDEIFDYRIVAVGVEAKSGKSSGSNGWRFGVSEYGELNEYNADGSVSCKTSGQGSGYGSSTDTKNWCYESRYANKTYDSGIVKTALIETTDGEAVNVEGINGQVTLYEINRKNSGVYDGDPMGSAWVEVYGISLIERVYYIDYDNKVTKNVIAKTYITPIYSEFSEWQDTKIPEGNDIIVETRTLYSHPLYHQINYDVNGGVGSISPTLKYNSKPATLSSEKPTKEAYMIIGWGENKTDKFGSSSIYKLGSQYTKEISADITLYAVWEDKPAIEITDYNPKVYNADGSLNYTNNNVIITIKVKDKDSGLEGIYLTKGKTTVAPLIRYDDYKNESTIKYTVEQRISEADGYYLKVVDRAGLEAYTELIVPNIDKESPYQRKDKINYCDTTVAKDASLELFFADDCSGLDYWEYKLSYVDAWGETHEENWLRPVGDSVVLDMQTASRVNINIRAYDKAGNVFTTSGCAVNVAQEVDGKIQLVDYKYVFAIYDEMFGKSATITSSRADRFIKYIELDDNVASKSCLNYLQNKVVKEGLTKQQALKNFFDVFQYEKR